MSYQLKDEELDEDESEYSDEEEQGDFPVVLILSTGLWTVVYAVFSFGFDTDPDSCIVSYKNDLIPYRFPFVDTTEESPDNVDVKERFQFFFNCAFFLSCVQLSMGTLGLFVRHKESWFKQLLLKLFWLANVLLILVWGFAFFLRYMHSGRECSGDFIVKRSEAKYLLYVEGMFLKFTSLLVFFLVLLLTIGHVINCCQRLTGGTTR